MGLFSDSLNLSDITLNLRTRLLNILDITFSSRYDPYIVNNEKNANKNTLELLSNNRLARFVSANTSVMLNLSDKTFFKKSDKENEEKNFYKIPWNLNVSYNLTYNKGYQSSAFSDTTQSLNFDGNVKLGEKWKFILKIFPFLQKSDWLFKKKMRILENFFFFEKKIRFLWQSGE